MFFLSGVLTNSSYGDPVNRSSPTLMTNSSATPTPTGSSSSTGGVGLYAKINKKTGNGNGGPGLVRSKRESPDEGIQDDVSTDV